LGISPASWSLFGVVWDSSQVLTHIVQKMEVGGLRILEVGCGIGLASLLLNQRQADITATDYHPEAETFLQENTKLNHSKEIPFIRTAWNDPITDLGYFDLIIGSDLLYEPDHVEHLSNFINQHSSLNCQIIIVDPGRFLHKRFSKRMQALGFAFTQYKPNDTDYLDTPFKGRVLSFTRNFFIDQ